MAGKESPEDRTTRLNNEGQEDAAKGPGNYDPPHGLFSTIVNSDRAKDNEDYTGGYRNGVEQRK